MRIVFMGTPEFAVASLDILLKNKFNVVGVVTVPDKPAGRGQQMHQSEVKKYALQNDLKLLQPEKLQDPAFIEELQSLKADLQLVVAFRMLPEIVWNMPTLGTYNLHASLLPKYRGAAPINWAIINGEKESGVTTFKLKHEIDTGNILFFEKVSISDTTTAGELYDSLMHKGATLMLRTVNRIQESIEKNEPLEFLPQDDTMACHAPKIFKETCRINWNEHAEKIYNLIRGLSPYPSAYTELLMADRSPMLLKIYTAEFELCAHNNTNGSLFTDGKNVLKVYCSGGIVNLMDVQLQGKKRMLVPEFLRGFKITEPSSMM